MNLRAASRSCPSSNAASDRERTRTCAGMTTAQSAYPGRFGVLRKVSHAPLRLPFRTSRRHPRSCRSFTCLMAALTSIRLNVVPPIEAARNHSSP